MEMASRRVWCTNCGRQITVPSNTLAIQCTACQTIIRYKPNDPLYEAQNSIYKAASRFNDILNTASSSINMVAATVNSFTGSGKTNYAHFPQPAKLSTPFPVSPHGRKRALLCGVSYHGQRYRLKGTDDDVRCMSYFLIQKLGFPADSILVLTEQESDPSRVPTKNNIRRALQWLIQGCQSGDSLVFHYSGHGSQQLDYNRDEVDGFDEMILPVDHQTEGTILDNEINNTIVRPLPRGAKLHAIIDACHSGTILDLPFVCRMNREGYCVWEDHGGQSRFYKGTNGGLAVTFSACDDHQISVDTTALSGNTATGAMTYSFIEAVQNEPGLTYGRLINAMRHKIHHANKGFLLNGPVVSFLRKTLFPRSLQEPQLSSSETFDIHSKQFTL